MKSERELIEESKALLSIAESIQDETKPVEERRALLNNLSELYHNWYRSALALFDAYNQPGERQKFEQEYIGTIWSSKILKFLTSGLQISPLYDENKPVFEKWVLPFPRSFKEPLLKQCNLLASLESITPVSDDKVEETKWNTTVRRIFRAFIEKAENAKTNHEKKLTYEYLAIFLVGAIDGLTIIGHDQRGTSEEVDVWVANESADSFWQKMGTPFMIECKNWSDPVGVQEVRNLRAIMDDKNVTLAILISKNGITGDTRHEAVGVIHNTFRTGKFVVVLDQADLLEIANGIHPATMIKRKMYELYMRS